MGHKVKACEINNLYILLKVLQERYLGGCDDVYHLLFTIYYLPFTIYYLKLPNVHFGNLAIWTNGNINYFFLTKNIINANKRRFYYWNQKPQGA